MFSNNRSNNRSFRNRSQRSSGGSFRSTGSLNRGRSGGGRNFGRRGGRNSSNVDISSFIRKAQEQASVKHEVQAIQHAFTDFGFQPELVQAIVTKGYVTPTPIQDQVISLIMEGRDAIGLANTGTGKTAAFLLPVINKILKDSTQKVLIIVPVRELADQISKELMGFTHGMRIFHTLCIGGMSISNQIANLRKNPHIVIGTPGRLRDLINRKALSLGKCQTIILDEVDRMFDMGFSEDIGFLLGLLPAERQSLFFSATLPLPIKKLAETYLRNPVQISVKTQDSAANVAQDTVSVDANGKFEKLVELLKAPTFDKVLVFVKTKMGAEHLSRHLNEKDISAESIHGDKTQAKRLLSLKLFKENKVKVLIATDVAARGLDIPDVSHVINYDKPSTYEDYIHRIGRTGRGDKKGTALTFV